ncbi:prepilin-type N-terminal cleavage/methylation domain-containing protein [Pseudoalteromonas sp. MMG012]|nr:prepilin-type N-terminal cleavage/methylation domain-containing protein [Pseudoalteromonas sp. MMG012]
MRMRKNGFSLLEVMVSMLVAGLALLGLAATQLKSLQFANNSFDYTMSLVQGQNAIERLWVRACRLQLGTLLLSDENLQTWLGPAPSLTYHYSITLPDTYANEMQVTVSWQDKRTDNEFKENNNIQDQITLNASYITLDPGCTPL